MRHCTIPSLAAALLAVALAPQPGAAQGQPRQPLPPPGSAPQQQRPPQAQPPQQQQQGQIAPPRPYKPVTISAPAPVSDPSFAQFRQQIVDVAKRKDKAALSRLVVTQGFFWESSQGDKADARKSGIDNLAAAIGIDSPDGSGWDVLTGFASDPTGSQLPQQQSITCAPAEPTFDEQQFEQLVKSTNTDESEWGYTMQPGVEVRSSAQPNAPVVEKLGMQFVRVLPDENPSQQGEPMLRVVAPSGKVGFVKGEQVSPLGNDQICYTKEGNAWKIAGFIGGE